MTKKSFKKELDPEPQAKENYIKRGSGFKEAVKAKKKPCTYYIEPAIYDQLKELEKKLRRGPTFIVNEALEDILKKYRINRK